MAKTNKTPELRFAGFTEDWDEKKAKELCSISTGKSNTQDNIKDGIYPFYVRSPIIERSNKFLFDEEAVLTVGDGVGTGKVHHYVNGKYDLHQRVYRMFDFKEVTGKYFYLFFSNNFHAIVTAMTAKSSVDSVRLDMIAEMNIKYPEIDEQKLIGNFFENIDKLINEHQHKHSKLKALKKATLAKMFPKQGQLVPEIRFKGFGGNWKEKKLGEIGKATGGTSIESEFVKNGKYKVISIGSYSENSTYTDQGLSVNLSEKIQQRILNKYDLTMVLNDKTASGNILGRVLLIEEDNKFVYNQRTQRIEPDLNDYNSNFLYHFFNAPKNRYRILKMSQGNTQIYVNWSAVKELKYLFPSLEEQNNIANYFNKLDELITNHETQITKLQNIRKAFLTKMFI